MNFSVSIITGAHRLSARLEPISQATPYPSPMDVIRSAVLGSVKKRKLYFYTDRNNIIFLNLL